jgi:hypothetical protein
MQTKKRSSILKADLPALVQIMQHEVDSLYKLSKAEFTEVFFNTMISINLKLKNSTQAYLQKLLEMTGNHFKADSVVLLSREEDSVNLYQVGLKDCASRKVQSKAELALKKFDALFAMKDIEGLSKDAKGNIESLVRDLDTRLEFDDDSVFPVFKIAKINKMKDIPVIGLFLGAKVDGAVPSQSIFTL